MESINLIALDPGRTTGVALASKDEDSLKIDYFQAKWNHLILYGFLHGRAQLGKLDHVVCESFEFRQGKQKTGVDLYPCELIGIVKLFEAQWALNGNKPIIPLTMQTAAQGKGYYDDRKLRNLDLYKKAVPHGRDACRHLLQWLFFGPGYKYMENKSTDPEFGELL